LNNPTNIFQERQERTPLDIPKELFTVLFRNMEASEYGTQARRDADNEFRCVCTWLLLKIPFYNGIIKNISKRRTRNQLAEWLDISDKTLRTRLDWIVNNNLARLEYGHLHLASKDVLRKKYGIRNNKCLKITIHDTTLIKEVAQTIAIERNFTKQIHALKKRIFGDWIKENYDVNAEHLSDSEHRRCKRMFASVNKTELIKKYSHRYIGKLFNSPEERFSAINPTVTVGCWKLSKLIGRQARSTGHYQSVLLQDKGLIDVKTDHRKLGKKISGAMGWQKDVLGRGDIIRLKPSRSTKSNPFKDHIYHLKLSNVIRTFIRPELSLW
jgi:hypothetical protein